jgi:presenilin-like A22 family membrane protease
MRRLEMADARDERFAQIDLRATAATGLVLIVAVVVAFLVEIARGHDGNPYMWLGAIAGLTYALSVAVLRWRG